MMISPETCISQFENATYEELIKERDGLSIYPSLREIVEGRRSHRRRVDDSSTA